MSENNKSSGVAAAIGAEIDKAMEDARKEYATVAESVGEQQKKALNFLAQQQDAFLEGWKNGIKQGFESATTTVAGVTDAIHDLASQATAAQKQTLDAVAAKNAAAWDAAQQQWNQSSETASDSVKRALTAFADAQREILNFAKSSTKTRA